MVPHRLPPSHAALDAAVSAAREAGRFLLGGLGTPIAAEAKAHRHDPVTAYDREADRMIADALLTAFPGTGLISEERPPHLGTSGAAWVVDPLDGTNNFLRGVPDFAVSIALVDRDGPFVGCVYDPARDATFTATRGGGARRDDTPIRVSSHPSLEGAMLGVGFSTEPALRAATLRQLPILVPHVRGLRIVGSAALDLAYVAAGRFDAAWYLSLSDWDVAAGRLLVTEAGGRVTDLNGAPLVSPHGGVAASNGLLHASLLAALRAPNP